MSNAALCPDCGRDPAADDFMQQVRHDLRQGVACDWCIIAALEQRRRTLERMLDEL